MTGSADYKVADIALAEWGRKEIDMAESEMPGDGAGAGQDQTLPGVPDTAYVHEDLSTPYVRYDYTTRNLRPEQGPTEELPFAQDGETTR